jgi:hypothetical protein
MISNTELTKAWRQVVMAEVEALVESLWELDDDVLEAQLGSHVQAIEDEVAGRGVRGAGADPASLDSIALPSLL